MSFPRTSQIASHFEVVAESPSTNAELRDRAADATAWPHLSALLTTNQTAGRGRLDRSWLTPPGSAVAVSVLLRDLPAPAARGWIPLVAGAAMADAVAAQAPGHETGVKWPNDVLVDGRKICGILAEATADAVIVGAGINTRMTAEQLPVRTATSFAALGVDVDEDRLVADYLAGLGRLVASLAESGDDVRIAVSARCLTLGRRIRASLPTGEELVGTAVALGDDGALIVETDGTRRPIAAGDVVHVRPA